ncbi:hypothetical protein DID88_002353 [Monilinia fructigena]|uniref:SGNH hydrolase-type esterase domain-containing protein n=1 Tax=Monilinia fructigena TaxID=38457 RepID=A0A395IIC3_9HELO|nr:hypothetical protein DID88_002353 [Monilinia fructigena]
MVFNFKLLLAGLASTVIASPLAVAKPPAFLLAGDSTTAIQKGNGGGWGDGFLTTLRNGAGGINYGHNGATTVSFLEGGDWAKVLASVAKYKADYTTFVTIQFGHNDQKPSKNITVDEFKTNLKNFASDVVTAGATPILVTSLSRRGFTDAGVVKEDLAVQVNATIEVAKSIGAFYIDLNRASTDYLNDIGATNAATYNRIATDFTHLNAAGSVLFGNMVSGLIRNEVGTSSGIDIKTYTKQNATIAADIASGTYILPSGFGTLPNNTLPA